MHDDDRLRRSCPCGATSASDCIGSHRHARDTARHASPTHAIVCAVSVRQHRDGAQRRRRRPARKPATAGYRAGRWRPRPPPGGAKTCTKTCLSTAVRGLMATHLAGGPALCSRSDGVMDRPLLEPPARCIWSCLDHSDPPRRALPTAIAHLLLTSPVSPFIQALPDDEFATSRQASPGPTEPHIHIGSSLT